MRTKKIFIPLLLTILLCNLSSCKKKSSEYCLLDFRVNFINKSSGECYTNIDSLLTVYGLDTLCIYLKQKSPEGVKVSCIYKNDNNLNSCLSLISGGVDFDKRYKPTFIYAIGKTPNFIDTIELEYNGTVAEIRINGLVQEKRVSCGEEALLNIIK